ncbi:probable transmembrane reductase CYB561D1 [Chironomus tepperi]|uniref:probable transmembrane reductase CYB561D1 n=1 Tax=Chironomus tepperi TaxID=113505 RepID=UPI00391F4B84
MGKNQKDEAKSKSEKLKTSTKFLSGLVQLALTGVAVFIVFKTVQDAGIILYTFHPSLMAIGYLILMAQGILGMSNRSIFTESISHDRRVKLHWISQTFALILITIAQTSIFVNKNINGYPHYQTIHSICGLVTYIMTLCGTVGGICNNYSSSLRKFMKPVQLKVGHGFAGSLVYVLASATICVGINQVWGEDVAQIKLASIAVILISALYIVSASIKTALARAASMSKK